MWLALLVVGVLALVGGFLGTLLDLALWAVVLTALVFAALALLGHPAVDRSRRRTDRPAGHAGPGPPATGDRCRPTGVSARDARCTPAPAPGR